MISWYYLQNTINMIKTKSRLYQFKVTFNYQVPNQVSNEVTEYDNNLLTNESWGNTLS